MEEAERLCDRMIIIDHGKVIADDTLHGLHRLLPVTNVLAIELEDPGTASGRNHLQALAGSGVGGSASRASLRVGVRDLSAGAPEFSNGCRITDIRISTSPASGQIWKLFFSLSPEGACATDDDSVSGPGSKGSAAVLHRPPRRIVSLLVPIVLRSFFGYLFGGQGGKAETSRIPVLVIDQDGSAISRADHCQLSGDKTLDVKPSTLDEARERCEKGRPPLAVVIPKDFGADAGRAFFARREEAGNCHSLRSVAHHGIRHGAGNPDRPGHAGGEQGDVLGPERPRDVKESLGQIDEEQPRCRRRKRKRCAICWGAWKSGMNRQARRQRRRGPLRQAG